MEDSSSSSVSTSAPSARSYLDVLQAPTLSDLTRKRRVNCNPPVGRNKSRGQGSSEPKSLSPRDRVTEFPEEGLTVSNGKLFCSACREELSLRKNIVANHISSNKHKIGKEKLSSKIAQEKDIASSLKESLCHTHAFMHYRKIFIDAES